MFVAAAVRLAEPWLGGGAASGARTDAEGDWAVVPGSVALWPQARSGVVAAGRLSGLAETLCRPRHGRARRLPDAEGRCTACSD